MNRAIWLLSIAAFVAAAMTRMTDALLPEIARDFGARIDEAAIAITAFTAAYGTFQLAFGWIGGRLGPYRTAAIGCSLAASGAILCAVADSLTMLAIGRFWSGMTVAAVIPMSMAFIGETVGYDKRQPVIARFLMGQVLGVVMGQAFAGFFAQIFDWRDLFWALAAGLAIVGILLLRELKGPLVPAHKPNETSRNPATAYANVLRVPWARLILLAVFAEGLLFGTYPYLAPHLSETIGLAPFWVGVTMSCFGLGGFLYILLVSTLHARLGEAGFVIIGGSLLALGYLGLALINTNQGLALAAVVLGFGYYMLHNTLQTNATQMAPFDRSAGIALFASCLFLSQALGTTISGWITLAADYTWLFAASAVLNFGLGMWLFSVLRTRRPKADG